MEQNNETFSYTYSATQQEAIKRIRQKYQPPEETKMDYLCRLDRRATRPGLIVSLVVGVISTLLFGVGMCCTTVWQQYFTFGVLIGIVGMVGGLAAYPLYSVITKHRRKRLAPEVMKLSDELLGN